MRPRLSGVRRRNAGHRPPIIVVVDGSEHPEEAVWEAVRLIGALQVPVETTVGREDPMFSKGFSEGFSEGFSGDDTAIGSSGEPGRRCEQLHSWSRHAGPGTARRADYGF